MSKYTIPVILGTSRKNNESFKVARYLHKQLSEYKEIDAPFLDLGKADFPLLVDRVTENNEITPLLKDWTALLQNASGIIIVSPEYKSGYPGSLKNFLDYLPPGIFRYKPVGISTVSSGIYAGTSCLQQLRQVVIAMSGLVIPDRFQIGKIQEAFNAQNELNAENQKRVASKFISELLKYTRLLAQLQGK